MVAITFPTSHSPGSTPSEGAGRLCNAYAEALGEKARASAVLHRVPGLVNFGTTAQEGFRGGMLVGSTLFTAWSGKLVSFSSSGGAGAVIGNMNGTAKGFFASNNAATPDMVFVDPEGNIATFTTSAVTNGYPDGDLPAVNSVTSIDGYLVFTCGNGEAWATGLNVVSVDALSFGEAEAKPDGLYRGISWGGRLYLFGLQTTEVWTNQGLSPFPFAKADVIPRGIAGPYCVTGHEDGFSKGLHIVGDDNAVYRIDGNTVVKISPPDLDGLIESVEDKTEIEMCSYISRGHAFVQVSSATWTYVLDITNNKWHSRKSDQDSRSRITGSVYAFGKWLCGDTETGNLQEITKAAFDEVGDPLAVEIWSAPVEKFPRRIRVASIWLDFSVGVSDAEGDDPIQTDAVIDVSWSDDGGTTFSTPRIRKLGLQSEGKTRIRVNQCGMSGSQGRIVRVRCSDPVHFALMGGEMSAELRVA